MHVAVAPAPNPMLFAASAVKDCAQMRYAGIMGTYYEVAVMSPASMPSAYSPLRIAASVSTAGYLLFTFSETVPLEAMHVVPAPNPTGSGSTVRISLHECSPTSGAVT